MSADSKRQTTVRKSGTPSRKKLAQGVPLDFPLCINGRGYWAKKVRGKVCYFGKVADDPKGDKALKLWNEQKDDLYAGRKPRSDSDGLLVWQLCDRFVQSKDAQLEAGEITQRSRNDYKKTTDGIIKEFGKTRLVTDLGSDD